MLASVVYCTDLDGMLDPLACELPVMLAYENDFFLWV